MRLWKLTPTMPSDSFSPGQEPDAAIGNRATRRIFLKQVAGTTAALALGPGLFELQAVFAGGSRHSLRDRKAPIHSPEALPVSLAL